ncbi:hypothetical protein A4G26_09770 [Mycobacterium kansasii]|nr:hypothetical protein A4G26_09770 [Mycobacterium kansasii]
MLFGNGGGRGRRQGAAVGGPGGTGGDAVLIGNSGNSGNGGNGGTGPSLGGNGAGGTAGRRFGADAFNAPASTAAHPAAAGAQHGQRPTQALRGRPSSATASRGHRERDKTAPPGDCCSATAGPAERTGQANMAASAGPPGSGARAAPGAPVEAP